MGNNYATGKYALGICDICGFQFKLNRLKMVYNNEKPTNLLACSECWTPDHPQNQLGRYPVYDPQALKNPRPDTGLSESRKTGWGWNPVAPSNPLTPSTNELTTSLGTVTVDIS